MSVNATFNPAYGAGVTVAPGVASASTAVGEGKKTLCITNLNNIVTYVRVGGSGVAATVADYPVPALGQVSISKDQDQTHVAYITAAGVGSLHIIPGEGF
jgi:hypothetical protein